MGQKTLAAILVLILSAITLFFFLPMKQLPSPVYGGDVYYHYGVIKHIYDGNSPLENSQYKSEWAHYPWLMHAFVAYGAKLFHIDAFTAAKLFPVIMTLLSGIIAWWLARKMFGGIFLPMMFTVLFTSATMVPMLTATAFTMLVTFPLFVVLAFYYRGSVGKSVLIGVALGLVGLSHIAGFVAAIMLLGIIALYNLVTKQSSISKEIKNNLIILIIGGLLASLYWAPLIIDYGLHTPNRWSSYVASGEQVTFNDVLHKFNHLFLNDWNLHNTTATKLLPSLIAILAFMGLVFSLLRSVFRKQKRNVLPILLLLTAFIGFIHPMITLPLFGISIGSYGFDVVFILAIPLLVTSVFYFILANEKLSKAKSIFVMILASVLVVSLLLNTFSTFNKDRWTEVGRAESQLINDLRQADVVMKSHGDGTILPLSDEGGFAISAVTGEKIVFARRTHTSPFVDANKRYADAAVMLFGNNSETKKQLFKKYEVKYLYADQYSIQSLAQCYSNWAQMEGDASFSCLRTSPEWTDYLTENGIIWKVTKARLDPASISAPTFDVVAILPNPIKLNIEPIFTTNDIQISLVKT